LRNYDSKYCITLEQSFKSYKEGNTYDVRSEGLAVSVSRRVVFIAGSGIRTSVYVVDSKTMGVTVVRIVAVCVVAWPLVRVTRASRQIQKT
jgi:hypothetical protein